jgi:GMP synthase (glutamine-hydrolysing)
MNVLAVVHGSNVPAGVFGDEVERRGHRVAEWSLAWGTPPPAPIDDYGAVMIFGGSMHADQDDRHPWLREENLFVQRLLDLHVPLLGICLGAQLIAKAAHAPVRAMAEPEVGWVEVELTAEAADDPVFSGLPSRFSSFQWHFYEFGIPAGACELARSSTCPQAFRLGGMAWGVEFHPEVNRAIVEEWLAESPEELPGTAEGFLADFDAHSEQWETIGRSLCGSFVEAADRVTLFA